MYAISSLLYATFAQSKGARAAYLQRTEGTQPILNARKRLRQLYHCIETGDLPAQQYDALLATGVERQVIEHALEETRRQRAEEARRIFKPSLTALFAQSGEPSGSRTTVITRALASKVTLPQGIAAHSRDEQLAALKACVIRHRRYLTEHFSPAARAVHLGALTGYCYRPDPDSTVLLNIDGEPMTETETPDSSR